LNWSSSQVRRTYLESLGDLSSLYKLTSKNIYQTGGGSALVAWFGHSVTTAVCVEFPEEAWSIWQFQQVPKQYWKRLLNGLVAGDAISECSLRLYLDHLWQSLNFDSFDQWKSCLVANSTTSIPVYDPFYLDGGLLFVINQLEKSKSTSPQQVQGTYMALEHQFSLLMNWFR